MKSSDLPHLSPFSGTAIIGAGRANVKILAAIFADFRLFAGFGIISPALHRRDLIMSFPDASRRRHRFHRDGEVLPEWLDYNDHMNVAYYIVAAFDLGIDAFKAVSASISTYIEREKRSTVALESHITYQREASLGEKLRVNTRLLDYDGKRCHIYQEMYRDELLSTLETLSISFDTALRKSCPFADDVAPRYQQMHEAQNHLPIPEWVGKSVGIKRKNPAS